VLRLVPGGKERQDSVYNALKALKNEDELEIVLVHDGVRPFFNGEQVRRLIQAARSHGAAVLGLPAQDTLKTVTAEGEVRQTLERRDIWQIQTPQAFRSELLADAYRKAYEDGFYGTDDTVLVERMGIRVKMIPGAATNFKITTPEDLALAEAILCNTAGCDGLRLEGESP
jgi:2-C-methyl-D-erythritol 4-phosphate cytidylyltransferase